MDPAHNEYSRGMTAYKAGDLKTAAVQFERVLEIDPAHGTASVNLAVLQCEFAGVARTKEQIAGAIGRIDGGQVRTRFDKGVAGRGVAALSDARKNRIRTLTRHFPETDFTRLGL